MKEKEGPLTKDEAMNYLDNEIERLFGVWVSVYDRIRNLNDQREQIKNSDGGSRYVAGKNGVEVAP